MARFEVRQAIEAPADFVAAWWTDYGPQDSRLGTGIDKREAKRLDPRRIQLHTDMTLNGRKVRMEGIVTLEGPHDWHIENDLHVNGSAFGWETVNFHVEPSGEGSVLRARFKFKGRTPFHGFLLFLAGPSTRREREEAYRTFAKEIRDDFVRTRTDRAPI